MPSNMTTKASPRPAKGSARKLQQARRRLAQTKLAAASVLVRERDGNCCRVCGSLRNIEVHHVVFRSQGGTHHTSNLACVCRECHEAIHARRIYLTGDGDGDLHAYVPTPKQRKPTPAHL